MARYNSADWERAVAVFDTAGLSVRTYMPLVRAGIRSIRDLADRTEANLLAITNIGPKALDEVTAFLEKQGLHLASQPDGYCIIHHRALGGSTLYFGPFTTVDEARDWLVEHPQVSPYIVHLYRTVDWRR